MNRNLRPTTLKRPLGAGRAIARQGRSQVAMTARFGLVRMGHELCLWADCFEYQTSPGEGGA